MVGIDHNKAKIEERELFAFTKSNAMLAMERLKEDYQLSGCVILSTCNRTELWISGCDELSPWQLLCQAKKVETGDFGDIYVERQGMTAVEHLLELSCGLKSKVFGEDQIITQLKDALDLARQCHAAGSVLETCFRTAISGAKKVKTYVRLTPYDSSVATSMVNRLKEMFDRLEGVNVLVVGNGEMGRLAAKTLLEEGCRVTMTLRQYKRGGVVVPEGCSIVLYEERLNILNDFQVIVSVTTSPHYTFHGDEVLTKLDEKQRVWMDLAVPRDIDPLIGRDNKNVLFDIDSLGGVVLEAENNENVAQAKAILAEYRKDFEDWYYFRDLVPMVQTISQRLAEAVTQKSKQAIGSAALAEEEQERLRREVQQATQKAVSNLLYGVKDHLDREQWQDCLVALERSAHR